MNKLIVGIVVIAVAAVAVLIYLNLDDSVGNTSNTEGSLQPPELLPAQPSVSEVPPPSVLPPIKTPKPAPAANPPASKPAIPPPPVAPVVTPPPAPPALTPPPPPPASTPTTHAVSIQGFAFSQASINVKKDDTVVWTNKDSAPHTVTGDGNQLSSQTLNNGGTYSFTFTSIGTFNYHCAFHPGMTGTIVVTQ